MIKINNLLGYDGLKIYQDPEMFSFSLDSILLANFASIKRNTKNIIDLCTGNAPIPIYLTLRTNANIYGVEIQKEAFDLAEKSIKENNITQIEIINNNLINIHKIFKHEMFDLVTCNPPFFKYVETSNINKNDFLTIARHEVLVTLDEIVFEASRLLKNGGSFAMVHRPDRLADIIEAFRKYKIEPKRLRFVHPKKDSKANHILIEGIKNGQTGGLNIMPPLIVYDGNEWTEEVREIYNYKKSI